MLWKKEDIQQYVEAKEYIDTLLVPLVPLSFNSDEELEKNAYQAEVIQLFTNEIEKEFKGRIFLSPNYTYLSTAGKEKEADRLSMWVENIKKQPFEHVFFFTFDSQWKKQEKMLDGTMIWLPAVQAGDLRNTETQSNIKGQASEINEFIRSYWL